MKLKEVTFHVNIFHPLKKVSKKQCHNGPLAGYPVDSLKVTLIDGSYHAVDSDQLSFEVVQSKLLKLQELKQNQF
jgi:elongation factor G